MKPFMVIKVSVHEYDMQYRRRALGDPGDGYAYFSAQEEVSIEGEFNQHTVAFGTTTEHEAHALAKTLCEKFPMNKYVVAAANTMYQVEIGPVKAAKYSEKGLMPV